MSENTIKQEKFNKLQGIRALAFLAIFAAHSQMGKFEALGAWGVSIFIVLSGFLMAYSYLPREVVPQAGLRFAWSKVKKLYPLHIVTMLTFVLVALWNVYTEGDSLALLGLNIVLNVLMVQTYIPIHDVYLSLNGVSWFMAVSVITYAAFPLMVPALRKLRSKSSFLKAFAGLFVLEVLLAGIGGLLGGSSVSDVPSTRWIVYYFPPVRLVDFAIGCVLGRMFFLRSCSVKSPPAKKIGIGIVGLAIVCSFIVYTMQIPLLGSESIRYTLLFIPTTAALVWLVAVSEIEGGGVCSLEITFYGLGWKSFPLCVPYSFPRHLVCLLY